MTNVLALDQGTSGTKAHRLVPGGGFAEVAVFEHRQILPRAGWVEHDPAELLGHLRQCLERGAAGPERPAAIGLANQGETVVAWDRASGRPLANAIVWQDSRTLDAVERLRAAGAEAETRARAGLPLDPYFSAGKLRWLLDHADGAGALLRQGRLGLGTSDSFFLDRLLGRYVTDVTTASRTSLMSLATGDWDPELCRLFGVPVEALPPIAATLAPFGEIAGGALAGVPVTASAVDQQAALFGHGCHRPGRAKITFGTGAFALAVVGERLPVVVAGLLPTVAWQRPGRPPTYALEGGVHHAASAVNWARRLGLFGAFAEIESFAGPSALESGLVFVPALSGLGAPHWDRSAAGLWIGFGPETGPRDLVRAVLEGVALRAAELIEAMAAATPLEPDVSAGVSIDGGLSRNGYFRGFLAAALGRTVVVPATAELTGLGIAAMALVGAGLAEPGDPRLGSPPLLRVEPTQTLPSALRARFAAALDRSRGWR